MGSKRTLADLAEVTTGFPFKSAQFIDDLVSPRLLRGDNVQQGYLRWSGAARWPTDQEVPQLYRMAEGDVVLAMDRPWVDAGLKFASVSASDLPSFLVQRVARLRALPGTEQRYLHYLVASQEFTNHLLSEQTGTAIPHVSASQIKRFAVPEHTPDEQRAIAEMLGALDDKVAANRKVDAQSRDLAATIVAGVTPRVPLSELANASRSTVNPAAFGSDPVLHFSLPACDLGVPELVTVPSDIKSSKFKLDEPCVLVSKLNPRIPRIWDVPSLPAMMSLSSTEFVVLTPRFGSSTSVLAAALDDLRFSVALQGKVAGTSGSHQRVKPAELLATEVADITTLGDADADAITALGKLRASIVKENEQLAATRDSLLPLLMSGKLRVKDAEKQVGEVV